MTHFDSHTDLDQRVRQTRQALFQAFAALVLERPYEDIGVTDIIKQAGVSRSTFYQHYRNKDDILTGSMSGMFAVLADAACGQGEASAMQDILTHWWDNRAVGRVILNGPAYRRLARALTGMVQQRLKQTSSGQEERAGCDPRAVQLAEGQLATIRAWLCGEIICRPGELAAVLMR